MPASAEYFSAVRELCDETGALMMVDEVQVNLPCNRTRDRMQMSTWRVVIDSVLYNVVAPATQQCCGLERGLVLCSATSRGSRCFALLSIHFMFLRDIVRHVRRLAGSTGVAFLRCAVGTGVVHSHSHALGASCHDCPVVLLTFTAKKGRHLQYTLHSSTKPRTCFGHRLPLTTYFFRLCLGL